MEIEHYDYNDDNYERYELNYHRQHVLIVIFFDNAQIAREIDTINIKIIISTHHDYRGDEWQWWWYDNNDDDNNNNNDNDYNNDGFEIINIIILEMMMLMTETTKWMKKLNWIKTIKNIQQHEINILPENSA